MTKLQGLSATILNWSRREVPELRFSAQTKKTQRHQSSCLNFNEWTMKFTTNVKVTTLPKNATTHSRFTGKRVLLSPCYSVFAKTSYSTEMMEILWLTSHTFDSYFQPSERGNRTKVKYGNPSQKNRTRA